MKSQNWFLTFMFQKIIVEFVICSRIGAIVVKESEYEVVNYYLFVVT